MKLRTHYTYRQRNLLARSITMHEGVNTSNVNKNNQNNYHLFNAQADEESCWWWTTTIGRGTQDTTFGSRNMGGRATTSKGSRAAGSKAGDEWNGGHSVGCGRSSEHQGCESTCGVRHAVNADADRTSVQAVVRPSLGLELARGDSRQRR